MNESQEEMELRSRLKISENLRQLPSQIQVEEKIKPKWKKFDFEFLFVPLPLITFLLIVRFVYIVSIPDLLSPQIALLVGFTLGALAIGYVVVEHGNTLMEVGQGSLVIIVILGLGWTVPARMNQKRQINIMKQEIKQEIEQKSLERKPAPLAIPK